MQLERTGLHAVLERLEDWGARRKWIGPDPYEGLNSSLGRIVPGRRARQAVTQLYKRLPVSPPWPLKAKQMPNAKALALVLTGYSTPAGRRLRHADEFLTTLPSSLERMNLLSDGAGWGYHFNVVTRKISYHTSTPNAIATCFVVNALLDAHEVTGNDYSARLALAARPFLLSLRMKSNHNPYFAYVAEGSPLIHNANLLVCGALARLHRLEPDSAASTAVDEATATTVSLQRDDGLWPYGEEPGYGWIDNFHTAYTLDGLSQVSSTFGAGGDALERGLRRWRERFLEPDAWARYYPDRHFPLETHCCASAIDLLCGTVEVPRDLEGLPLADRIARLAIRELWVADLGRFAFRRTRMGLNRREFMRWTNAPMFRALATLCSSLESRRIIDEGLKRRSDRARHAPLPPS
jgi:polysaccharide biosynthesis protein VpsJ